MTTEHLAEMIEGKAREADRVMRNDDTSTEVKFYFFGIFLAELGRICRESLTPAKTQD